MYTRSGGLHKPCSIFIHILTISMFFYQNFQNTVQPGINKNDLW